ncbi:MAG: hydantoinase B/oxoprolinase family protein [Gammaproteobacteria bacterium]
MTNNQANERWQFWVDRGGTFTDIVAAAPDGQLITHKLLSHNPEQYQDAAIEGMRALLRLNNDTRELGAATDEVRMGTTVATNALLERAGDRTVLCITRGFKDALRIAYQNRPKLFAQQIVLPTLLYESVIEVDERVAVDGQVLEKLPAEALRKDLEDALAKGIRSVAFVFMHAYRFHEHEAQAIAIAQQVGFEQISASHQVSPLMKLVSRGDTTVVDAYLTPVLRRYVDQVTSALSGASVKFMQSNGGLTDAGLFQGKDSILSGPAGGIVGAVEVSRRAGIERLIAFDMGGTSTDVSHFAGEYERAFDTKVAGVRMRVPIMRIHTVAAGGGSILQFDGMRQTVGPQSAGAVPGPACYRRGGPLTVTDCQVMLGRLVPEYFPSVFGPHANETLDTAVVAEKFAGLADEINSTTGTDKNAADVAAGFLQIAIENMANAIKEISVQRGYDVTRYTLCSFGGAGGQHACAVADALGMKRVYLHPFAGVLSAFGMGLAALRALREQALELPLDSTSWNAVTDTFEILSDEACAELSAQGVGRGDIDIARRVHVKPRGSDSSIELPMADVDALKRHFASAYLERYGFKVSVEDLIVEAVAVEAVAKANEHIATLNRAATPDRAEPIAPLCKRQVFFDGELLPTRFYPRADLRAGERLEGPLILVEETGTTVVEPGWSLAVDPELGVHLERTQELKRKPKHGTDADPVLLEVFNNLFMSIAEQMGAALQNTAFSVNIKERLDFSCAVFDKQGELVANAPHMPVHLGSMGESVRHILRARANTMLPGDVFVLNDPYHGGTHLPDVTVVTPVFTNGSSPEFFVASRGHHADIGGIAPGSMPSDSQTIEEEGVLLDNFHLVKGGEFQERELLECLMSTKYPARNPQQNVADLKAQVAANERGQQELLKMIDQFGMDVVQAYMQHVKDNAEECVRRAIAKLKPSSFSYAMDHGATVKVRISVDHEARSAIVDFSGSSGQLANNFNAPAAVCKAAVLYVFRTLVEDDIPLNDGCLKPIRIILPEHSMLNPVPPAAVVAGNVETSQCITDCLYGALGVMSAAQGTMNNFTFGNDVYQYYETICGGSGAGPGFDGTDAVHTHMTNSRLTDPEVLEHRFPVRLVNFAIRPDSGGAGEHRGGNGVLREIEFLQAMEVSLLSDRRVVPPYGLAGGEPGLTGRNRCIRAGGDELVLGGTANVAVEAGDKIVIETPGGGGYGNKAPA